MTTDFDGLSDELTPPAPRFRRRNRAGWPRSAGSAVFARIPADPSGEPARLMVRRENRPAASAGSAAPPPVPAAAARLARLATSRARDDRRPKTRAPW